MASTRVVDDPVAGRFEILVDEAVAGFAAYRRSGATVSFTHTEIAADFAGRGLGSVLAGGALDAARTAGDSVLPLCPFIRRYVQRHPEYAALVPTGQRGRFGLDGN